jgi:hypothetical protein
VGGALAGVLLLRRRRDTSRRSDREPIPRSSGGLYQPSTYNQTSVANLRLPLPRLDVHTPPTAAVQQDLRLGANDPQLQLAEDTARALDAGTPATTLVATSKVDVATSLAPFLVIYDGAGNVLAMGEIAQHG